LANILSFLSVGDVQLWQDPLSANGGGVGNYYPADTMVASERIDDRRPTIIARALGIDGIALWNR
jgi:hypothetical protein